MKLLPQGHARQCYATVEGCCNGKFGIPPSLGGALLGFTQRRVRPPKVGFLPAQAIRNGDFSHGEPEAGKVDGTIVRGKRILADIGERGLGQGSSTRFYL